MQTTINYLGHTVYVNKVRGKGTIIGYPYGHINDNMHPGFFSDQQLNGKKVLVVNGGLFYTYDNMQYANGIEISQSCVNQLWDTAYDNVYGIGITKDFKPVFAKQRDLKTMSLRSAITGNFGILINGSPVTHPLSYIANYYSLSGRTVLGHDGDNWITLSFTGVTGKTGLSGNQLVELCKQVGCVNAICLDGGGSVYLEVDGSIIINTTRKVKNVFMVYKEEEVLDVPLKLVVRKQVLVLRKELKFVWKETVDFCPFVKYDHKTNRYRASGATLNHSKGGWIKFPIGSEFEITELLPGLQLDGWQWVKVLYKGVEYYAQYDSMAYSIEAM